MGGVTTLAQRLQQLAQHLGGGVQVWRHGDGRVVRYTLHIGNPQAVDKALAAGDAKALQAGTLHGEQVGLGGVEVGDVARVPTASKVSGAAPACRTSVPVVNATTPKGAPASWHLCTMSR